MTIIKIYQKELELFKDILNISIIHRDKDICFYSNQREILYAIYESFMSNSKMIQIYYKESILGKAVIINLKTLPTKPPFSNLIFHYKKFFFERLDFIDNIFCENQINNDTLNYKKNKLRNNLCSQKDLKKKYTFLNLPNDILDIIISYIFFDYKSYQDLRKEYQLVKDIYQKNNSFKKLVYIIIYMANYVVCGNLTINGDLTVRGTMSDVRNLNSLIKKLEKGGIKILWN